MMMMLMTMTIMTMMAAEDDDVDSVVNMMMMMMTMMAAEDDDVESVVNMHDNEDGSIQISIQSQIVFLFVKFPLVKREFSTCEVLKMAAKKKKENKAPPMKKDKPAPMKKVKPPPMKPAQRKKAKKKLPQWIRVGTQLPRHIFLPSSIRQHIWAKIGSHWCRWQEGLWVPHEEDWQLVEDDHVFML